MKLGYDAKRLFCNVTGLGNYSRTLVHNAQHYAPQNKYYLYTPKLKKLLEAEAFHQNEAYQIQVSKAAIKTWWRSFGMVKQLQKDGVDIYHGLSNELPVGINKTGVRSIVTVHDLIFKIYPQTYPFFDRQMYDLKFKTSCIQANKIIAISESTKNDIIQYYDIAPEKIEVIYQSCSPLYFEHRPIKQTKFNLPNNYVLFVGSIIPRKNLKLLIETYKILPADFAIPVVVVGQGKAYKNKMKALISAYGLADKFMWLGGVNDVELKALYTQAQLLVYPSLYEGFGLPVAEALLCKTPVITSNTSSLKEAGGDHSIYINPIDAAELAGAIQQVLSDADLSAQMKEAGFAYAHQHFSAQASSQKLMACYEALLKSV